MEIRNISENEIMIDISATSDGISGACCFLGNTNRVVDWCTALGNFPASVPDEVIFGSLARGTGGDFFESKIATYNLLGRCSCEVFIEKSYKSISEKIWTQSLSIEFGVEANSLIAFAHELLLMIKTKSGEARLIGMEKI